MWLSTKCYSDRLDVQWEIKATAFYMSQYIRSTPVTITVHWHSQVEHVCHLSRGTSTSWQRRMPRWWSALWYRSFCLAAPHPRESLLRIETIEKQHFGEQRKLFVPSIRSTQDTLHLHIKRAHFQTVCTGEGSETLALSFPSQMEIDGAVKIVI